MTGLHEVRNGKLDPRMISPELVLVDPELGRAARAVLRGEAERLDSALVKPRVSAITDRDTTDRTTEGVAALSPAAIWAMTVLSTARLSRLELELQGVKRELAKTRQKLIETPKIEREQRSAPRTARLSSALGLFFSPVLLASLLMSLGLIGFLVGGSSDRSVLASSAAVPTTPPLTRQATSARVSLHQTTRVTNSTPSGQPTFAWVPARGATAYLVRFYRGPRLVFQAVSTSPRMTLPGHWRLKGRVLHLAPGQYRWEVRPVLGPRSRHSYGPVIVESRWTNTSG